MMQAYNTTHLYNKYVRRQASEAFHGEAISAETYETIVNAHPVNLYTPNYFIRIALGVLTAVAVLFSMLLIWLITGASGEGGIILLLVLSALLCYAALELLVQWKQYYNAGIDNVLMLAVITCLLSAFLINDFNISAAITSASMVLVCGWLCIRFTDAFMAILAYCALLACLFFVCLKMGDVGKAVVPFVWMLTAAFVYYILKKLLPKRGLVLYAFCLQSVLCVALVSFYASGNYFIVTEVSRRLFPSPVSNPTLLNWFFSIFTVLVPLLYLVWGVLKKDMLFMRTGIALLAATIFTLQYYYPFLPGEITMLVTGLALIVVCYLLIQYLRTPKHGFSFEKDSYNENHLRNVEALIIAQTFGKKAGESQAGFEFGGGSGGGGGATGSY